MWAYEPRDPAMLVALVCKDAVGASGTPQEENYRTLAFWSKPILQRASRVCQATGPWCTCSYSSWSGYYEILHVIRLENTELILSHTGNGKLRTGPGQVQGAQVSILSKQAHIFMSPAFVQFTPMFSQGFPLTSQLRRKNTQCDLHLSKLITLLLVQSRLLLHFTYTQGWL